MLFETLTIKDIKIKTGNLVKLLRKKENLSQDQLAVTLDLSRITIQNLESGKNITLDTLLKVFQHFDILEKFDHFVDDEIKNRNYSSLY
ncbi:helix-turn-helix domain-containing protein [Emticicia sp. CRIBPO]|uniref:helix-turn-helix transcriptional regulator n=1 Tax=Emticicia sp. CRIBPO TaxID=2683258 RepID=UPI00141326FD|nr:helix-turn-helix transcriptional regulator [Emticicia sp. CRIBPO]NBA89202.1 helix-turn-helix domain-containing protein [Emticicia sp. CRIBPO]